MTLQGIIEKAGDLLEQVVAAAQDIGGLVQSLAEQIEAFGGREGLLAVCVVLGVLLLVTVMKLVKVAIAALLYLVAPAVIIAILLWLILHQPFLAMLPLSAIGCSVLFLAKA